MILAETSMNSDQMTFLDMPFTEKDIKDALCSIDINKSPGSDGFTSGSSKDAWAVVRTDICSAMHNFFESGQMLSQVNATLISLIPKSATPSPVTEFHH